MAMKKKEPEFVAEFKRHMGVLVEGLRSEVRLVAEQHGSIINRLDKIDLKLQEHDRRFDMIDIDLKAMKNVLFEFSHRLDKHEKSEFAN